MTRQLGVRADAESGRRRDLDHLPARLEGREFGRITVRTDEPQDQRRDGFAEMEDELLRRMRDDGLVLRTIRSERHGPARS